MEAILKANEVKKIYGEAGEAPQTVLDGINLEIQKGEFVAIMGESGSGKSTLLYQLSGMDRPSSGSVRFMDEEISQKKEAELSEIRLNKMGFVFQQIHMLKNLTILDNILLPAYKAKQQKKAEILRSAQALMERMGIAQFGNREISKVSGGQLQRAAICRALINQPEVLFCDEPTGSLDSKSTGEVMAIIGDVRQAPVAG